MVPKPEKLSYTIAQTQPITNYLSNTLNTLSNALMRPQVLVLLGIVTALLVFGAFRKRQGQLTSARWADGSDKRRALKRAKKQVHSDKVDDVCLWIGKSPDSGGLFAQSGVMVPDANQSAIIIGRPKSGKTFSAINPMLKSAVEQGLSVVLYEYKADDDGRGGQMEYIATLAARHGYKLNIFAPGRDYSCTINPLDFLEGPDDDTTAAVLAEVFHKNLKAEGGKTDAFFGPAGQRLIQALMQFAKGTKYPDLAMAFAIARLPNLPERLVYADEQGQLPIAVQIAFSQFMQTAGAQKTSGGIAATASDVLTRFMSSRILPALLGETNISLLLGRKEMIVFQSDIMRQDVVNPILAAIINVLINRNFSVQRDTPLVFSADEFPTIFLPQCPTWPNEHRSKGFVGLFGFQSFPQIHERYGKEKADILISAVGSHFWFNPGNEETAKKLSAYLGEQEITIEQKSTSKTLGSNPSRSRSTSQQTRTKALMLPDEFLRFGTGECILLNPAYKGDKQSNLPQHFRQIPIPQEEIELIGECEQIWGDQVLPKIRTREAQRRPQLNHEELLQARFSEARRLLPPPPDEDDEGGGNGNRDPTTSPKIPDL